MVGMGLSPPPSTPPRGAVNPEQLGGHNVVRQSGGGATKWTYLMMAIGIAWATGGLKTMCWWALYALLGFIVMLYCNQNGMLYAPAPPGMPKRPAENPPMMRSPAEFGMNYKDVKVECADGVKLSAWMITQPSEQACAHAPTVLYFHGNAGNIGMRLKFYHELYSKAKCNILAVDYRGYGDSEGSPSEAGLNLDADAALKYVQALPGIDAKAIFVFGRSLGGAVAMSLAARNDANGAVRGVIAENTFTGIGALATHLFPVLRLAGPLLPALLSNRWDSLNIISQITAPPILFLSAGKDEIIPPTHMKALHKACANVEGTKFKVFPLAHHNDMPIIAGDKYHEEITAFLEATMPSRHVD